MALPLCKIIQIISRKLHISELCELIWYKQLIKANISSFKDLMFQYFKLLKSSSACLSFIMYIWEYFTSKLTYIKYTIYETFNKQNLNSNKQQFNIKKLKEIKKKLSLT